MMRRFMGFLNSSVAGVGLARGYLGRPDLTGHLPFWRRIRVMGSSAFAVLTLSVMLAVLAAAFYAGRHRYGGTATGAGHAYALALAVSLGFTVAALGLAVHDARRAVAYPR